MQSLKPQNWHKGQEVNGRVKKQAASGFRMARIGGSVKLATFFDSGGEDEA